MLDHLPADNAAAIVVAMIVVFILIRSAVDWNRHPYTQISPVNRLQDNVEQVKLLFDYTKFHITVYSTLATLLVGISASSLAGHLALHKQWLLAAFTAIVAAGLAAGVVAATMPSCTAILDFWNLRTGPYDVRILTIRSWTYVEHTSFWIAVACVILAFLTGKTAPQSPEVTMTIKG